MSKKAWNSSYILNPGGLNLSSMLFALAFCLLGLLFPQSRCGQRVPNTGGPMNVSGLANRAVGRAVGKPLPHSAPVCEKGAGDSGHWVPWGLQTGIRDISASAGPAGCKQAGSYTGMRPVWHGCLVPWGPAQPQPPLWSPLDSCTPFLHPPPFSMLLWKLTVQILVAISSADEVPGVGLLVLNFCSSHELQAGWSVMGVPGRLAKLG